MIQSQLVTHFLLPTDLSRDVWPALQLAIQLGQAPRTRLTLLHVFSSIASASPKLGLDSVEYLHAALYLPCAAAVCVPTFRKSGGGELQAIVDEMHRKIHPEWLEFVDIQAVVREGNAPQEILRYAQESQVDTIVMSAKPRSGWLRFKTGVADQVLRDAKCRVVLIHQGPPSQSLRLNTEMRP